tara:strand:- start:796 stop:954 length:159 start_codon:yes stop_codon:yes gene_type:complete
MITFLKDESGATAIEYGMLTGFAFGLITTVYGGAFHKMSDAFDVIVATLSVA